MASKSDLLITLGALAEVDIDNPHFEEKFLKTIQQLVGKVNVTSIETLQCLQKVYNSAPSLNTSSSWRYVCLGLECLVGLKDTLRHQSAEADKLLSVAQQRSVRALLDRVISVGLLPNLLPGVEPLSKIHSLSQQSSFSDIQKYECLCLVTLTLVELYHDDMFHGLLLPQFLSPVLCALCQLTMVPLRQSADTYSRLLGERLVFQQHLDHLVTRLYQPMVVKELMVIQGNKSSPKWLMRGVGRLLTTQLHKPSGVLAVVQAVRDAANCAAPTSLAHLESLAHVIMASPDLACICSQVLELLDLKDAELVRVAVLCMKTLHTTDSRAFDTHLLQPMVKPLALPGCSEHELTLSVNRLHKCVAVPASDFWCLPSTLLQPHIYTLFLLYCRIYQSASHIRKTVEDLVWCFLSKCRETELQSVFRCLVLKESIPGVKMIEGVEFVFSDDAGVKLVQKEESEISLEEFGDCLMILLERRDTDGFLGNKLFITLLEIAGNKREINSIDFFERQLVTVKLLAVLSENAAVQKNLSEYPKPVVEFLKEMIDSFFNKASGEIEIISLVLVLLNVILNDCIYSKTFCWQVFSQLEEPLLRLKSKTGNEELRLLAEEAYEVIMTHGAVKSRQSGTKVCGEGNKEKNNLERATKMVSSCDEALREACDELLPVRGHAIMQLGKLLAERDKQAMAKKDQILCIFQENVKHDDSFLYLSAIEGMAVASAQFPDSVIMSLTEQFSRTSLHPDTRLKVGEALVRVTRLLGELVPVYKAELINAFLSGTRDEDSLVRASSLSSLGELCRVLGFRVGPILSEVLMCVRCIVGSDPSVEVRRAAVLLVSLLLKGLHKDTLTVLQDVLLELYQVLKHVYSTDKDDVTRLHAQLALEQLNAGTLAFLFPKPQLTKQIFVLDPPS